MIQIRAATDMDLDAICQLSAEINYQHHLHEPKIFVEPTSIEDERALWRTRMLEENGMLLLACDGNTVVGFITVRCTENSTNPLIYVRKICQIGSVSVAQERHKHGIGKLLMNAAMAWGREQHAVEVRLEVMDFNHNAMAFYQRLGFDMQSHIMRKSIE